MIDYPGVLRALTEARVEFIIVGGAAATAHGSARLTQDLDVVYARDEGNLARLAGCLAPHEPYLRGAPKGLPFELDARTLARGLNFSSPQRAPAARPDTLSPPTPSSGS